ncbi:TetR/AcrR family transcriptional regulator [Sphingomonas ginsenosidivorax]|uniref:TetR/AcrR family transcriptional regulator n=1 Tax=Sphingomonas ginsenosidivorax TaxID=862135 RepID=A0A5C6UC69_9SPHN|nr:TetR/AcrR family transcriptional regulator [Sphingomonas ginsenosidivorax]TXC70244.1 TetR/AcrR family transcriptional regulator [Sphingomonas ginsenosidivorax]
MTEPRTRRARDPVATRAAILEAARALIARDGPDGMSVSAVAALAGVNRGTAYQHFATREDLVAATMQSVSDQLFHAAFGDPATVGDRRVEDVDITLLTTTLADFAVDNPALCRIWFLQLLASDEPAQDPFWREYAGSLRRFTETDLAERGIDSDVFSMLMLAGNFLWPVWTKAHEKTPAQRRELSRRFAIESLRLSMHGTMRAERFPEIEALIADRRPPKAGLRAV